MFADRISAIATWDEVKLLTVKVDRLDRWWKPGLLCIGDAAHAMSPVGGVGFNLAIQDAVATANILGKTLCDAKQNTDAFTPLLRRVQKRRMLPTVLTQAAQIAIHERFLLPALSGDAGQSLDVPWSLVLLNRWSILRALPPYAVGIGIRPDHFSVQEFSVQQQPICEFCWTTRD